MTDLTVVDASMLQMFGRELSFAVGNIYAFEDEEVQHVQVDNGAVHFLGMQYVFHTTTSNVKAVAATKGDFFSLTVGMQLFTFEVIRVEHLLSEWSSIYATCKDITDV